MDEIDFEQGLSNEEIMERRTRLRSPLMERNEGHELRKHMGG